MDNKTVAHNWANNRTGKGSNFYSESVTSGYVLKSYDTPIGYNFSSWFLMSSKGYSKTTSKQQNYMRAACRGSNQLIVSCEIAQDQHGTEEHIVKDTARNLIIHILELLKTVPSERAKVARLRHFEQIAFDIESLRSLHVRYYFEIPQVIQDFNIDQHLIAARAHTVAQDAKRAKLEEKNLKDWIAGKNNQFFRASKIHLRINGDKVETSQGAFIYLETAKKLFKSIVSKELKQGDSIGNYSFNRYDSENIVVGCHTIPLSEVNRLAAQLGLI